MVSMENQINPHFFSEVATEAPPGNIPGLHRGLAYFRLKEQQNFEARALNKHFGQRQCLTNSLRPLVCVSLFSGIP